MTGEPVAPRCLSVFTSLHLTANCSRRSREANSVVWEAEIIQMDGSHDPHIPPAWISLAGLVECGEADDVWDGEEGEEEVEGGGGGRPLPSHCQLPPHHTVCLSQLSQVISSQLGQPCGGSQTLS